MNEENKFTLMLITIIVIFACVAGGLIAYQETHTPKYYIDFQDKRYELKEIKK